MAQRTATDVPATQPLPFDKAETIAIQLTTLQEWISIIRHVGVCPNAIKPQTLLYLAQPIDDAVDVLWDELAPLLGAHARMKA